MGQSAIQVTSQKGNNERGTPTEFIRKLQSAIDGKFSLDPCSGAEPVPIAETRFTKEDNGLAQDWSGHDTVFVNPPYSDLKDWLKKVVREANREQNAPNLIITLLPGNTSTQWFHRYAAESEYLCLVEGRLTFNGTDKNAPFASIMSVFGENISDDVLEMLDNIGTLYTKAEVQQAAQQARLDDMFSTDGGAVTAQGNSNPTIPPLEESGPQIRDVSIEAPAVPQGVIDFYDIGKLDKLTLSIDDTLMGVPESIPSELSVRVVSGERATDAHTQTPDDWTTLLCVDSSTDPETYVCLYQNPDRAKEIKCSISPDTVTWTDVTLEELYRTEAAGPAIIEPHGEATSYVC